MVNRMLPLLFFVLLSCGCSRHAEKSPSDDGFPSAPFTFVGLPEKILDGSYDNGEGRYRTIQLRVLEVTQGAFAMRETGFFYPDESPPPLELGKRYLFTAVYDRHGLRYTHWNKINDGGASAPPPVATRSD